MASEEDKQALLQDESNPFFSTPHFDGHPSVLVRESRLGEITRDELVEVIQDAWLAVASARRASAWLAEQGLAREWLTTYHQGLTLPPPGYRSTS